MSLTARRSCASFFVAERCRETRRPEAMVEGGELTDAAWARIAPLMPENRRRGKQ